MKEFLFLVVIVVIFSAIMYCIASSDNTYINKYCAERNYKVLSVEHYVLSTGPFSIWTSDDTRIYKVVTDKKIVWIRFGWYTEVIEENT